MPGSAAQPVHSPIQEARPTDILIADELTLVREGLAALCSSLGGYRVVAQVGSAAAALAEIDRLQPAIALLDLGLSDLAATEVIRRIRDLGVRTRCAVLSLRKDRKTVLEVLRTGACGFLLKSFAIAPMVLVAGGYLVWTGTWRRLRLVPCAVALGLFALIVGAWAIARSTVASSSGDSRGLRLLGEGNSPRMMLCMA